MASLTGQNISASYEQLLSLPDGGGNSTSQVAITDGDGGTEFSLTLATTSIAIAATHNLYLDGGGNSYLSESAGDRIDIVSGGNTVLSAEGTNKFVGINDTAPEYELDVNDTSGACTIAITAGGTAQASYLRFINSTNHWRLGSATGSTFTLFDSTNSKTVFSIAANAPTNALVIEADGNVRFNSASTTSHDLRIDGPADSSASIMLYSPYDNSAGHAFLKIKSTHADADAYVLFEPDDGDESWSIGVDGSNSNKFMFNYKDSAGADPSDASPNVTITTAGNVGIGTSTPSRQLAIAGATAGISISRYDTTDANHPVLEFKKSGNATVGSHTVVAADTEILGALRFYGSDGDSFSEAASIYCYAKGTVNDGDVPGELRFGTTASGGTGATPTTAMTIKENGYVGINTTTPEAFLEISDDSANIDRGLMLSNYYDGVSNGALLVLRHARGTEASPTTSQSGDDLGNILWRGYDDAGWENGGYIKCETSQTWTASAHGTRYTWHLNGLGTTGPDEKMRLNGSANLALGTTTIDTTGTNQITLANGTEPSAADAHQIYIGAKDSAGTGTDTKSTLALFCEEGIDATALDAVGTLTTRIPIWVNGTCYWLYLDPV